MVRVDVAAKQRLLLTKSSQYCLKEIIVQGILTGSKPWQGLLNYQQIVWICFGVVFFF